MALQTNPAPAYCLVELADRALYRAKQAGRDRVELDETSAPGA